MKTFKIIVLGDSGVGKTSLTYRFCDGKFLSETVSTVGFDFREREVDVDGEIIKLQLWDTAGQERFRKGVIQHYYRNADAVVFVYDVTSYSSFKKLPSWFDECKDNGLEDVARILIGNKCDCDNVCVNTNEAQKFADQYNMPLFETSAKEESRFNNIDSIFLTLAHKLKNQKPLRLIQPNENKINYITKKPEEMSGSSMCCY